MNTSVEAMDNLIEQSVSMQVIIVELDKTVVWGRKNRGIAGNKYNNLSQEFWT